MAPGVPGQRRPPARCGVGRRAPAWRPRAGPRACAGNPTGPGCRGRRPGRRRPTVTLPEQSPRRRGRRVAHRRRTTLRFCRAPDRCGDGRTHDWGAGAQAGAALGRGTSPAPRRPFRTALHVRDPATPAGGLGHHHVARSRRGGCSAPAWHGRIAWSSTRSTPPAAEVRRDHRAVIRCGHLPGRSDRTD